MYIFGPFVDSWKIKYIFFQPEYHIYFKKHITLYEIKISTALSVPIFTQTRDVNVVIFSWGWWPCCSALVCRGQSLDRWAGWIWCWNCAEGAGWMTNLLLKRWWSQNHSPEWLPNGCQASLQRGGFSFDCARQQVFCHAAVSGSKISE